VKKSPLHNAEANAVSVCGKILTAGQSITVPETAIGPRERKMESRGKLLIRSSNKEGQVQVVCTLGKG
jgi:hypothetical protein